MSNSIIETLTSNAALPEIEILVRPTDVVDPAGNATVLDGADTQDTVSPNCIIKYVNLRLQLAVTDVGKPAWYEYALIMRDNLTTDPTVDATSGSQQDFSDVNTATVGDIAKNLYRGNCIWTGAFASNPEQSLVVDIPIKIPEKWCKWKRGQYLTLVHYARGAASTDTTTIIRCVWSSLFKCYL